MTLVTSINFACQFHYFALGPTLGERYSCNGEPGGDLYDPYGIFIILAALRVLKFCYYY